jgi:fucose permease
MVVTSFSVVLRASIFGKLSVELGLKGAELATIASAAFWGFPLVLIVGGIIIDLIGMKRLIMLALICHLAGVILLFFVYKFSRPLWPLLFTNLLIGIANGIIEAVCNPLVATLHTNNKTTKLNHLHGWFSVGIVLGTVIIYLFDKAGISWQVQIATLIVPTLIYGYLFSRLEFPVTERVSTGISTSEMFKSVASPLFILLIICMLATATTELFTGEWINLLLKSVSENLFLILTVSAVTVMIGRSLAGPIVHRLKPQGVLLMSAIIASLGLYILSNTSGMILFLGAAVFSLGICYFWPTMLGLVSEYLPGTGALGINLMGAAGAFGVTIFLVFMGGYFERLIARKLPDGANLAIYKGPEMKATLEEAHIAVGPDILRTTLLIPLILIVFFAGLTIYLNKTKKPVLLSS